MPTHQRSSKLAATKSPILNNNKVSVSHNVHEGKRLLLNNLKELYAIYKEQHANQEIVGFSKFCALRPKWCKVVRSPGGHNVCECAIHQNTVLAADACEFNYKELMSKVVCDSSNKMCMVHRCPACPGAAGLKVYLEKELTAGDNGNSDDYCDEVSFQQWQYTDRTLVTYDMDIPDYTLRWLISRSVELLLIFGILEAKFWDNFFEI